MNATTVEHVLTLDCPESPGIVHAVSGFLVDHGGDIIDNQQFGDGLEDHFFMRVHLRPRAGERRPRGCEASFAAVAAGYSGRGSLEPAGRRGGCSSWCPGSTTASTTCSTGAAPATSRRRSSPWSPTTATTRHLVDLARHPVHTAGEVPRPSPRPRRRSWTSSSSYDVELVVLARYMQVLSDDLCARLGGRAINIHHSFLPELQGRQALPPGPCPRREAGRGHRPLRHPGSRRGADHRPAGDRGRPQAPTRGAGRHRPRRRGGRVAEGGPLALRGPGAADGNRTVVLR